uniref:Uncharacterized protein n=1 Tax=Schistosoma japonicum TaxID=6182 RepID=Q5C1F9_SCHJA|nr:unknown [Schistosoma japonicum]
MHRFLRELRIIPKRPHPFSLVSSA